MFKKIVFLMLSLAFILFSSANAKNIIWVCMNQDGDGDGSVTNDFQEFTDGLTAEGYTVDIRPGYWDVLNADKVTELNAADLVIFSRSIQSGVFATDSTEISLWNSVTAPIMNCSPYVVWSHRWNWVNNRDTLPGNGDQGTLTAFNLDRVCGQPADKEMGHRAHGVIPWLRLYVPGMEAAA